MQFSKDILLFLLLTISIVGYSQNVNIPDPYFKQRCILNGYDTTLDGEIDSVEAAAVLIMDISYDTISNLTGIGAFSNITYLDCRNNSIDTLVLDNHASLTYLDCYGNWMDYLEISSSGMIEYLNCAYNDLETIDLSVATQLNWLDVSNNHLQNLDPSNLMNLEFLSCALNSISTLDLTSNANLKKLSCGSPPLNSLNTSGLLQLKDVYLYDAQNLSLDLTTNIGLDYLHGSHLYSANTLDLSGNLHLRQLTVTYSDLTQVVFPSFSDSLQWVNLNHNNLNSLDFTFAPNVKQIEVIDNELTSLIVNDLKFLETLLCDYNELPSLDVSGDTALQFLNMEYNNISTVNYGNNINLTSIYQRHCQLSQLHNLWEVPNLNHIDASYNPFTGVSIINGSVKLATLTNCPNLLLVGACEAPSLEIITLNYSHSPVDVRTTSAIAQNLTVYSINGTSDYFITTNLCPLDITDEIADQIRIYPNPAINQLSIDTDLANYNLEIVNLEGKSVYSQNQCSFKTIVEIAETGVYIAKITTDEGTATRKIVIQ
jgi:hypothetical protein